MSIYEAHLGSWARVPEEGNRFLSYRELAQRLVPYVKSLGFTHIELLPVMEHPFSGSWGYQVLGFFAPTSRFGPPEDFKALVDACHQAGLGVILDWVPGHFPKDDHGLARFDGTALYEHADPRQGEHQEWGTLVFNYGRNEVRNFLLSNALFWLEQYHVDGLRVDAVASMLYLDYSRKDGEWVPNRFGGRENLEAVGFIQELNTLTHGEQPGTITAAEESTAWPGVSRPVHLGGLGFSYKWNMGWMHDMLAYIGEDPVHRRWHHNLVTFSMLYAYTENYILPFSHDEVVHGKRALLDKVPGDVWQKYATLRTLYGVHVRPPGEEAAVHGRRVRRSGANGTTTAASTGTCVDDPAHAAIRLFVADLNALYRAEASLHQTDADPGGLPLDRLQRQREQRRVVRPVRARPSRLLGDGVQLHARAAPRLPRRRARGGLVCGADEQRRGGVRRRQRRERRRRRHRAGRRARLRPVAQPAGPAARMPPAEEGLTLRPRTSRIFVVPVLVSPPARPAVALVTASRPSPTSSPIRLPCRCCRT